MCRVEPLLAALFERSMACHQEVALEDADFVGKNMDIEDPPSRGVRRCRDCHRHSTSLHARPVAPGATPPDRVPSARLESLIDDPTGRGMHPKVGDPVQPMAELTVEIVEIAEGATEEEVLADIAEWSRSTLPFVFGRYGRQARGWKP
jgi:hypothetical protein